MRLVRQPPGSQLCGQAALATLLDLGLLLLLLCACETVSPYQRDDPRRWSLSCDYTYGTCMSCCLHLRQCAAGSAGQGCVQRCAAGCGVLLPDGGLSGEGARW